MKREIKFRAWDGDTMFVFSLENMVDEARWIKQHDWKVMQYTGLKDRNGKEMWEGDICRVNTWESNPDIYRNHPNLFKVFWSENSAKFEFYSPDEMWGKTLDGKERETDIGIDVFLEINEDDQWEIIGNIYENPDLLGGEGK